LQWPALERIGRYVGAPARFDSLQAGADALWDMSSSFGPHTAEAWRALSEPMLRALDDGGFALHYDPAIGEPFRAMTRAFAAQSEAVLWTLYDAIRADTLLLRGAVSDLISAETADEMSRRGPCARVVSFDGVGHAPTLVDIAQSGVVADFLLGPAA